MPMRNALKRATIGKATIGGLRLWIVGAIGAAVNAGVGGITVVVVDPNDFNPFEITGLTKLGKVCAALALVGFALYVREHPIKPELIKEDTTP